MLDSKSRLIRIRLVATGTVDSAVVHPREVFREAAAASAAAIVLFHNHPSGDPTPSEDDLILTNRMVQRRPGDGHRCRRSHHPWRAAILLAARSRDDAQDGLNGEPRTTAIRWEILTVLYFDCFSGASGDMILGSLIDAGVRARGRPSRPRQPGDHAGYRLDRASRSCRHPCDQVQRPRRGAPVGWPPPSRARASSRARPRRCGTAPTSVRRLAPTRIGFAPTNVRRFAPTRIRGIPQNACRDLPPDRWIRFERRPRRTGRSISSPSWERPKPPSMALHWSAFISTRSVLSIRSSISPARCSRSSSLASTVSCRHPSTSAAERFTQPTVTIRCPRRPR